MPTICLSQERGDSIRIETTNLPSRDGVFLSADSSALWFRYRLDDVGLAWDSITRVRRWKRNNPALMIGGGIVGGMIGFGIRPSDTEPIAGSTGGDVLLGAGIGAVIGLVVYQILPGSWRNVNLERLRETANERMGER